MLIHLAGVLDNKTVTAIARDYASDDRFEDGRKTAGKRAAAVKDNLQATASDERNRETISTIHKAFGAHSVFQATAFPKAMMRTMISRYNTGMSYGYHVDAPLMERMRTDLSFTLFLCEPDSYEGGELIVQESGGERSFKLPAGDALLYPSTSLHRVAEVTRGSRLVAVGWVRSQFSDPRQRETLFEMGQTISMLNARNDEKLRPALDLLSKTRSNLIRMWIED